MTMELIGNVHFFANAAAMLFFSVSKLISTESTQLVFQMKEKNLYNMLVSNAEPNSSFSLIFFQSLEIDITDQFFFQLFLTNKIEPHGRRLLDAPFSSEGQKCYI